MRPPEASYPAKGNFGMDALDLIRDVISEEIERERVEAEERQAKDAREWQEKLDQYHAQQQEFVALLPEYLQPFAVNNKPTVYDPEDENTKVYLDDWKGIVRLAIPGLAEIVAGLSRRGTNDPFKIGDYSVRRYYYRDRPYRDVDLKEYGPPDGPDSRWIDQLKEGRALVLACRYYAELQELTNLWEKDCVRYAELMKQDRINEEPSEADAVTTTQPLDDILPPSDKYYQTLRELIYQVVLEYRQEGIE